MWLLKRKDLTTSEAVKILAHAGGGSAKGKVEYRGREYVVQVTLDEKPTPEPVLPRSFSIMTLSSELEHLLLGKHDLGHIESLPWLTLPSGYSFKVTFPFAGAAARFRVCKTDHPDRDVSVYLDTKDVLGHVGSPYWEAYPIGGDTMRFGLAEGKELIDAIVEELENGRVDE
ncbi:MAG: hypothetical protein K8U57_35960 [Planctomycetes bacterium]|nr:hypothetical protein [Planctomycetota bacterium]